MNYTLDTDAIRKLFSGAIVGIRGNHISVLLRADKADKEWYMDLTQGQLVLLTEFDTLIRPGDECEVSKNLNSYRPGIFKGFSGECGAPFYADAEYGSNAARYVSNFCFIRPLPEPVVEVNPELEQARLRIENAERELSEARAALERASK